jgi:hypothetical protein
MKPHYRTATTGGPVFNKEGDRPHGYEYPSPSIEGGSIGAKSSGRFEQLTDDDLARVRTAAIGKKDALPKTRNTDKK